MRDIGPLWFNVTRYGLAALTLALVFVALGRAETVWLSAFLAPHPVDLVYK